MTTPESTQTPGPGYDAVTARTDLVGRLAAFHERVGTYLPGDVELDDNLPHQYAEAAVKIMTTGHPTSRKEVASAVLLILFGGGLYVPDPEFWRTDLGQLVYEAGDWPGHYLSVSEATHVLRVSRGRVHQLLAEKKIERSDVVEGAPIAAPALRERWEKMRAVTG